MYKLSIISETNDGVSIDRELATFEEKQQAVELAEQLNELLRVKLLCIYRDLLSWRFDISQDSGDGTFQTVAIMDSDSETLQEI